MNSLATAPRRERSHRPRYGSIGGAWSVAAASVPDLVDVAAIRNADGNLTQQAFAKRYGFTWSAVRDWEQGRKKPERSARIVLALIAAEPEAVRRVLGS
jgi:putative transcriptional regulator